MERIRKVFASHTGMAQHIPTHTVAAPPFSKHTSTSRTKDLKTVMSFRRRIVAVIRFGHIFNYWIDEGTLSRETDFIDKARVGTILYYCCIWLLTTWPFAKELAGWIWNRDREVHMYTLNWTSLIGGLISARRSRSVFIDWMWVRILSHSE